MEYVYIVIFLFALIMLLQLFLFQKVTKWKLGEGDVIKLDAGKYNIIVDGQVSNEEKDKMEFVVLNRETNKNITAEPWPFVMSGASKLKQFSIVASFTIAKATDVSLNIKGIKQDISMQKSGLSLKIPFLGHHQNDGIYIGVTKTINRLLFMTYFILMAAAIFMLR